MVLKIYDEICIGLVKLDKFKYTYNDLMKFIDIIKIKKKKEPKISNELVIYKKFVIKYCDKNYQLKDILKLWEVKKIDLLKNIKN